MLHLENCIDTNYSAESSSGQDHILKKKGNRDITCDGKEISKRKGRKIEYKCDGTEISWEFLELYLYGFIPTIPIRNFILSFINFCCPISSSDLHTIFKPNYR